LQTKENRAARIAYGAYGRARHIALLPRASELEVAAEKKKKGREGSTHIVMDIRYCSKEELDAINERARAWKVQQAKQIAHQTASPKPPEQLELPITEEQIH
jgi:hypothetical protein